MTAEGEDAPEERYVVESCRPPHRCSVHSGEPQPSARTARRPLVWRLDRRPRRGRRRHHAHLRADLDRADAAEIAASVGPGWDYYLDRLVADVEAGHDAAAVDLGRRLRPGAVGRTTAGCSPDARGARPRGRPPGASPARSGGRRAAGPGAAAWRPPSRASRDQAWCSRLAAAAPTSSQPVSAAASAVTRSSSCGHVAEQVGVGGPQREGPGAGRRQQGQVVDEQHPGVGTGRAHRRRDLAQRRGDLHQGAVALLDVDRRPQAAAEHRHQPQRAGERGGVQAGHVPGVVAADRDRHQRLVAVQRGDLGRRAVLLLAQQVARWWPRSR